MLQSCEFAGIICDINKDYKKYAIIENGKKVLYARVLKIICRCIESALLWYELFSKTLKKLGFEINPCDKCATNKIINRYQCAICWYVGNNKLAHKDLKVVIMILEEVKKHFGDLVISRGNKHDSLGIHTEMSRKNKIVEIEMRDYLQETIDMFGENINGTIVT